MSATSSRTSSRKKRLSPHSLQDTLAVGTVVRVTPNQFDFSLPIPPRINSQYATVNGRRVLSSTGRQYKTTIAKILLSELAKSPNRSAFLNTAQSHYLSLTIHFYFPTLLKRALDGGLKISQDAVCEAMGINDNRIVEIHLYKALDRESSRLDCTLLTTRPAPRSSPQRRRPSCQ